MENAVVCTFWEVWGWETRRLESCRCQPSVARAAAWTGPGLESPRAKTRQIQFRGRQGQHWTPHTLYNILIIRESLGDTDRHPSDILTTDTGAEGHVTGAGIVTLLYRDHPPTLWQISWVPEVYPETAVTTCSEPEPGMRHRVWPGHRRHTGHCDQVGSLTITWVSGVKLKDSNRILKLPQIQLI